MRNRCRFVKVALLSCGLMALLLAGGVAVAGGDAHVFGVLEAKDVRRSTLTVSGVVYEVGDRTRMWDSKGASVTLEDLVPTDLDKGVIAVKETTAVEVQATEVRGRWLLLSLRVVEQLPQ